MAIIRKLRKLYYWLARYGPFETVLLVVLYLLNRKAIHIPYRLWLRYSRAKGAILGHCNLRGNRNGSGHPLPVIVIATPNHYSKSSEDYLGYPTAQCFEKSDLFLITARSSNDWNPNRSRGQRLLPTTVAQDMATVLAQIGREFVICSTVDWVVSSECQAAFALVIEADPSVDVVYSDSDCVDAKGRLFAPHFKPCWCPDSFLSGTAPILPCMCRISVLRNALADVAKNDYWTERDLELQIAKQAINIVRIPAVLFHRRISDNRKRLVGKSNEHEQSASSLKVFLERSGLEADVSLVSPRRSEYLIRYRRIDSPKLSIIVPTRDQHKELNACLESIFSKSTYNNFEIVLVDNDSRTRDAKDSLAMWRNRYPKSIRLLSYEGPFNYSAINNYGVSESSGDYLLFLNNDVEVITRDWIEGMIEYAQLPRIGAVGAMLLYPDGRIQHAGVVIGINGCAGNIFRGYNSKRCGYNAQLETVQNYSAVTGACLMCRRKVFDEAGGFNADLAVSFNDVDFCLRLMELGYRNVYLPHVKLYHHEAASRGRDGTEEKRERTRQEAAYIRSHWKRYIDDDPCYNPNLSRMSTDYSLRVVDLEPDWDMSV